MSDPRNKIGETLGFTEEEFLIIQDFFVRKNIPRGEFFLKEGEYVRQIGFVEKGILREFLFRNDKEVTKWFSTSGHFAVDLSGFLFSQPSKVSYQALEDVEVLTLSKENYDRISQEVPRWATLEKAFLTTCFAILEDRVITHLSMNAEERYNHFFSIHPELFNQVPLNYLASMLGMTPETMSRIRKKRSEPIS